MDTATEDQVTLVDESRAYDMKVLLNQSVGKDPNNIFIEFSHNEDIKPLLSKFIKIVTFGDLNKTGDVILYTETNPLCFFYLCSIDDLKNKGFLAILERVSCMVEIARNVCKTQTHVGD